MVNAASALRKLSEKDISIKKAYELYRLTQKLNEYLGYLTQTEIRLWNYQIIRIKSFKSY